MKQRNDGALVDRRTVLRGIGAVAVTGTLAGCGGDGNGNGDDGPTPNADVPGEVSDYLSNANNFPDAGLDETGSSSVTVDVGAGSGNLAFGPAAVIVDTGTTITWEWTGQGGAHNVVHDVNASSQDEEAFNSGSAVTETTFDHTFESAGTYLYHCIPHSAQGMKGAVIVE